MTGLALVVLLAQAAAADPGAVPTPPPRAAAIAVGEDAALAGTLQRELDRRMAGVPGVAVRGIGEIASRIGEPSSEPAPVLDPAVATQATDLLDAAIDAYYQGQFVLALDRFAKLQALQEQNGAFPMSRRTQVLLWRIAVFLSLNDAAQADAQALAVLSLDPEARVDARSEIPPSVQQVLDGVRASGRLTLHTVLVNGLPPVAELSCDGRSVASRFKTVPGPHRLEAKSPGRRTVVRTFTVREDTSLTVSLPAAPKGGMRPLLEAIAAAGTVQPEAEVSFAEIVAAIDADWVVIADAGREGGQAARAAVWSRETNRIEKVSDPVPAGAAAEAALGAWAERSIAELLAARGKAKDRGGPVAVDETGWMFDVGAGLLAIGRHRVLSGSGNELETMFGGSGGRLRVDADALSAAFLLEVDYVSYAMSGLEVRMGDTVHRADGGSTLAARLGGAWKIPLGGSLRNGPFLRIGNVVDFEQHAARDARFANGARMNLLPGYLRLTSELRVGGRMPVVRGAARNWMLDVEGGVAPAALFLEKPDGASGDAPRSAPSFSWRAGLVSDGQWNVAAEYAGTMRSVRFRGESRIPVDPLVEDARIDESFHTFALRVGRRF